MKRLFIAFALNIIFFSYGHALDFQGVPENWVLKDIELDLQGYYQNTTGDGYIVLGNLNLTRADICGISFDVEFKQAPQTPVLMEVFWRSKQRGFSEAQKAFFILNGNLEKKAHQFVVPLCKLYRFSGGINLPVHQEDIDAIRVDYPSNRTITLKINELSFLNAQDAFASTLPLVEPYERLSASEFASLDVMLPKLVFITQHGLSRLSKDKVFLVFWLLLIAGLIFLIIKSFFRKNIN